MSDEKNEKLEQPDIKALVQAELGSALKALNLGEVIKGQVTEALKRLQPQDKDKEEEKDPTKLTVAQQIEALRNQLTAQTKATQEAQEANRMKDLMTAAEKALSTVGVTPDRLEGAMALLHDRRKLFAHDANGNPVMRGKDAAGNETHTALADAIKAWAGTPEGKGFLPAKPVEGSGSSGNLRTAPKTKEGTLDIKSLSKSLNANIGRILLNTNFEKVENN